MTYLEAIIFGIVQGITEFLPISSTAHLVIAQHVLGVYFPGLSFEIFLHQASLLAVVFFFRKDLQALCFGFFRYFQSRRVEDRVHFFFGLYIVVATGITGILGYSMEKGVGDHLKSPTIIAVALFLTGVFLIFIERFRKTGDIDETKMRLWHAAVVGLAQTAAVMPGISRSGATLVGSLWCGLNRETAVRYSFLLAIPVIAGSSILAIRDVEQGFMQTAGVGPLVLAFSVTFVCSVAGIVWLIEFLKKCRLVYFALYCFLLAAFVYFYFDPQIVLEAG